MASFRDGNDPFTNQSLGWEGQSPSRGAIGVGINIKEGTTLTAVHHSMVITHHPDTSHPLSGFRVPYWEEMLLMAARTFDMTGLGYLGVDIVIDRERGPLLLELNALPGLQIQIANQTGLLRRLELIDKATADIFATAEARVAWALEKFKTVDAYPEKWESTLRLPGLRAGACLRPKLRPRAQG